jgi:hypothetical protein
MSARWLMAACVAAAAVAFSSPSSAQMCVVADPTGTPLNVRTTPGGGIAATIGNGTYVAIRQYNGRWVFITYPDGHPIGWVFRQFLRC